MVNRAANIDVKAMRCIESVLQMILFETCRTNRMIDVSKMGPSS